MYQYSRFRAGTARYQSVDISSRIEGATPHRLVQIMKKRVDSFSLLLGGVQDFVVEDVVESEEAWRNQVVAHAKTRLREAGGQLKARQPRGA